MQFPYIIRGNGRNEFVPWLLSHWCFENCKHEWSVEVDNDKTSIWVAFATHNDSIMFSLSRQYDFLENHQIVDKIEMYNNVSLCTS